MKRIRFLMIGGFLGAGKTTAIGRLARHFLDAGKRVGLVMNDQAQNLVDTETLRGQGFRVGEVAGACFCCRFNDLIQTVAQLSSGEEPDIILAEPVGSCTDLVATVVEPLRLLYGQRYEVGPFVVLFKPEHGRKILGGQQTGFSPKAAYIFLKQLEEADVVAVNKIDKLSAAEREELLGLVQKRFPDKEVLAVSARQGDGFDSLVEVLSRPTPAHVRTEIDYDVYAEGEAELGWLNCVVRLGEANGGPVGPRFPLDQVLTELVGDLRSALARGSAEPAHLKILGLAEGRMALVNLVGSGQDVELSRSSGIDAATAELIVNARVATAPEDLGRVVRDEIAAMADRNGLRHTIAHLECFRPGRPEPTYRMPPAAS
ncbi:MAG: GTP-binding protein [Pirellulales bacterium]